MEILKRIMRTGIKNFRRGGVVSASSVLIVTIMLFVLVSLGLARAVLSHSVSELKNRFDVVIYMEPGATEDKVIELKSVIEKNQYIKEVNYTKKEDVLEDFKLRHKTDAGTIQALEEVGVNPFGAMLAIRLVDTDQYAAVGKFLEEDELVASKGSDIIEKITLNQNKPIIDKLNTIIAGITHFGLGILVVFAILSILIVYTMIRLGIYIARDEIGVMRLVGASNWYIRAPFLVEGLIAASIGTIVTIVSFFGITFLLHSRIGDFTEFEIFSYYKENIFWFVSVTLVCSLVITLISSLFAMQRYLKK